MAREQGWRPKDEWSGDPEQWKSAEQFVKDGKDILPIVQARADRLEERLAQVENTNREYHEFVKKSRAKDKQERDQLKEQLREARRKAVDEGDGEAFDNADASLRMIEAEDAKRQEVELPPEATRWANDNPWYGQDRAMTVFADSIAADLNQRGFFGEAYFDQMDKELRKEFAHKFTNTRRNAPPAVESDGTPPVSSSKKTFDNLPPDAQQACRQFQKDIPGFTEDDYLAEYEWE
jgi:hypothetical protein